MAPVARNDAPRGFTNLGLAEPLLLAHAATGTGKTAAFALPLIQRLLEPEEKPAAGAARKKGHASVRTGGLVLVPTRELAMQVAEAAHKYARGTGVSVLPLYGGAP